MAQEKPTKKRATIKGRVPSLTIYTKTTLNFRHRLYFRHIQCEKSFESCVEAAIKYCLENLI